LPKKRNGIGTDPLSAVNRSRWHFAIPSAFKEQRLIGAAVADYKDVADHNPQTMGKRHACYSRLLEITQLYAELDG
jgi:hypothetical protein